MPIINVIPMQRLPVIAGVVLFGLMSCNKSTQSDFSVMKGEFVQSITESGELEAIDATVITMPRIDYRYGYSFKIVGITEYGTMVEKGDSVVALDPSSIYKYIIQQEEALENAKAKAKKQEVEARIQRRDLEVQLKNQEASYNLKKLELERMQFDSGLKKKVKELEFQKATIQLEKIRNKLQLSPLLEKYDRFISELEVMQRKADVQNATGVLKSLVLYSPGNGYFITEHNRSSGHNYTLGDQVYIGRMIANIPDVSRMKVRSIINETDIRKVNEGMKVVIRLDALPHLTFRASLKEISKICTEQDKQKIFKTIIDIDDNEERLKPGMSVSCEYISYESDNELFVPNECLLSEGEKVYVFVKRGSKFKKTEVETGFSNAKYTVIHTKLRPGWELLSLNQNTDI